LLSGVARTRLSKRVRPSRYGSDESGSFLPRLERGVPALRRASPFPYGKKIETIAESGDCLGRGGGLAGFPRLLLRHRGVARCDGGIYGVDTHSGLHHRKRGPRVTCAQRVPCRRKSNLESQAESTTAVLRRRTVDAWPNWLPARPYSTKRSGDCRSARHHPRMVPTARCSQIRRIASAARSRPTAD